MRTGKLLAAALLAGSAALAASQPASAAPLMSNTMLSGAASGNVENVQYYPVRRYGYGPRYGYRGGYYRRGYGYGGTAAGVGIGLAAGAVIGGAIAASQAQAQQNHAYCSQRYRSYDPASGTYLNNNGNRYPCP
ncbi:MAG: BA14K family protein [Pseudomonadota bacterium]